MISIVDKQKKTSITNIQQQTNKQTNKQQTNNKQKEGIDETKEDVLSGSSWHITTFIVIIIGVVADDDGGGVAVVKLQKTKKK